MAITTAPPSGPAFTEPSRAPDTALATKVLLIGLDGATYTILDPLMQTGAMPFLRELVLRGVRAPLRSVIPALTPPAWTSLMTGKRPGEHGVFDFFQKDRPDSHYLRFASSQDIGSETIWSIASQHGKRVIALNFPLMFPAPAVNGYVVPGGWMPWRQLRLGCYPPGLFDRLKALPSFNARELALDMAFEEKAIEGCAPEEYLDWITLHMRRERRWFEILKHLMQEDPADLTAVLFDGVDKLQHLCWRFLDPAALPANPSPWERQVADLCRAYFVQLDELIEEAVTLAGTDTAVVLASDHGFGPTSDVFYLNVWLERHGYLRWAADATPEGAADAGAAQSPQLGLGQIARHVQRLDWEHTVAYAATPSSNGIHIVTRKPDGSDGVPPHEYDRLRRELRRGLLEARHPSTGAPLVADVLTREEAFAGPYAALGPDLTLVLADGGLVSILRADATLTPRADVVGTHRAEGFFLAAGPGLRRGVALPELSIVDVAPLLLDCIGLPAPADMTGVTPLAVLESSAVRARAGRAATTPPMAAGTPRGATHAPQPPVPAHAADVFDAEAEEIMLKRLQALGYVE
ncbi:MAG TPA: alkaline phosphatase family protein [Chloroflexota bacterium]|nr:alkaline phosphatase family protein [Chloroflexota bacterium]